MATDSPILIGLNYNEYIPGMELYLHKDYETYKQGDVVQIKEIGGYGTGIKPFKIEEYYFITTDDVKVLWNDKKIPVSCYVERNETTSHIESMIHVYEQEAGKRKQDVNYGWSQREHDEFLENKKETLVELLAEYERKRARKK